MTNYLKRIILISLMIPVPALVLAPGINALYILKAELIDRWLPVWQAVKYVESRNIAHMVNITEGAYGCAQIRQEKLNDFNRATGHYYLLKDCLRESVSYEVFRWHCAGFRDPVVAVKRWNGRGPGSENYWRKVRKQLIKKQSV